MQQPFKPHHTHDVLVIGSGAGGGMMAYALCKAGVKVLMLEAGRNYDPVTEAAMFNLPKDAPLRATPTPDKPGGYYDGTLIDQIAEPYTVADGEQFYWSRARMLGGRTNHWGRNVPRYGPDDFKPRTHTGYGSDWPISYEDIEPYYDRLESLMGVNGSGETCWNSPAPNKTTRQEPPAPRAYELLFTKACSALGYTVTANPTAILTSPKDNRSACFYATSCTRGCAIDAAFQSPTGFIKPALATGNLNIITQAQVYKILADKSGKAIGAKYIDKLSGKHKSVEAPIVVLAASAMESCRILLNSKTKYAPSGLGNSSGLVGRKITDSHIYSLPIQIPALENLPPHNEDGTSEPHVVAPWWFSGDKSEKRRAADFFGGYRVLPYGGGRKNPPTMHTFIPYLTLQRGLYGRKLKQHIRRYYGTIISLVAFGAMNPNENCYCELDPEVKDQWGIPVLKFHWQWSAEDRKRTDHMHQSLIAIAKGMQAIVLKDEVVYGEIGGIASHEIGGATMGSDPNLSVLNNYSQSWDIPNLYIADGASFPTHAEKNPTLTIMALAWRAAENIIERVKGPQL